MNPSTLTPPIVACPMPFNRLKPDLLAFKSELEFLSLKGTKSIVVNGTTGEFAGMTFEDRLNTLKVAHQSFSGYIINNISSCSIADSISLAKSTGNLAHALLLLPPFYFKRPNTCGEQFDYGCKTFFRNILKECEVLGKPVFLYNFPFHTGNSISPQIYGELCHEFPSTIIGIKDSSGDMGLSLSYKKEVPQLGVYVGNDDRALDTLKAGLDGSVTGAASPVVELMVGIQSNYTKNKLQNCETLQNAVIKWGQIRNQFQSDICVAKIAFPLRGVDMKADCLPPLEGITNNETLVEKLKEFINVELLKHTDICNVTTVSTTTTTTDTISKTSSNNTSSNNTSNNQGFSTRTIHAGQPHDPITGSVVPNIVLSSTFAQSSPGIPHGITNVHSYGHGFEYSRTNNPTRATYELCCASLHSGQFSVAFSSGMASISGALHLLKTGDNVLCIADAYGGTLRYISTICGPTYGITSTFGNFNDNTVDCVSKLISSSPSNTKMIWLESPSNPLLKVLDIQAISIEMHKVFGNDCLLVVDNTFMSPYFQRPLELGADLVIESATKYLNGHSDVVGGVVCGNNLNLEKRLRHTQNALGAVPSPFDCYLVLRGIKTLPLRMNKSASNAMKVALFLENHHCVEKCLYPGLPSHPQHQLSKKQMLNNGFGAMVVFYCIGGFNHAKVLLEGFHLWTLAESLGAVESLVESPAIMTHASIPKEKREELGIYDNLIRLSVGIENVEDLINDLDQALNRLKDL